MAIDGLSLVFFGKDKTHYLRVNDVIDWHVKELEATRGEAGSEKILKLLRAAAADFEKFGLDVCRDLDQKPNDLS